MNTIMHDSFANAAALSKKRARRNKRIRQAISYAVLSLLSLLFLFPIYCLLLMSVMPDHQLLQMPSLWPEYFNFKPYAAVVMDIKYLYYFKNTIVTCVLTILGACFASSFTAFGLAKVKFKGSDMMFNIILSTILLPGVVTSIPLFTIYDKLGWTGSLLPLWLPVWFGGGAMNIFLVRQFIKGIPNSLCEAALLDGATNLQIYIKIIIPLIQPILVYLAVMLFIGTWNDFQAPLMYVSTEQSQWTLSLALYKDYGQPSATARNLPNVQMAIGVLMMIPCALLYGLFQKQLMDGVATVGIKG